MRRKLKRLEPFARRYSEMMEAIEESPSRTLRGLIEAADAADVGNCWWCTFGVAPLVKKWAEGELSRRAIIREQKRARRHPNAKCSQPRKPASECGEPAQERGA